MSTVSSSTTNPVSVASSSSAGAAGGSVINVSSLVSQLVAATRAPKDAIISQQTQTVTTQISALGTLKSSLSTFQGTLANIDTATAFNAEAANTSDASIFTATANAGADPGSYSISVSQLASSQQLVSKPFTGDGSATVGTGTLQVSLGNTSFNVSIDSTHSSVSAIAAAINSASGNPGITATVVNGTDGAHMILSSTQTGATNSIKVAETDGGTGLAALTYDTTNASHYTQTAAAQDAVFSISGIPHSSSSNTVSDTLPGVTLTLKGITAAGTGTGSTAQLTVASDTATIVTNVQAFVDGYNALAKAIQPLGGFDQTTGTAGAMLGDPTLSGVQNDMRQALYGIVNTGSPVYNTLASVGIITQSDGTLKLDQGKLTTALAVAPSAVSTLFSGTTGVAATLNTRISSELGTGGIVTNRSNTLIKQENALTQQTTDLNTQMAQLTASMTQQYAQLNTLLSSLQTTSSYLTQQFASLPTVQSKS
jgi:flagellar hook-associated protein 2